MLYSYKWLQELSQTKKSPDDIAQLLLTHSFEVESVMPQAKGLEDVFIGHVLAVQKHPDADNLNIATVDMGEKKLQIVCGAPNLREEQKVPVAIVGAVLPGDFAIKETKIRGVESVGMICAPDELGLNDDHDGILVLEKDAPIGKSLSKFLQLDDTIIDIDVLPNRAHDALSHRGMAREIAMLEGRRLSFAHSNLSDLPAGIDVEILTPGCSRYAALEFTGITVQSSPDWLRNRLQSLGHKSINNIVDITNYIMLETGQPLHAFTKQFAPRINIRQAKPDEVMILLDDTEIALSDQDIVITDTKNPIALAGVMGGKGSAISDDTSDIVLEVAHFNARSVRATKSHHNLQTDAAYRFERDIDPNLVNEALTRAIELFFEVCAVKPAAITDIYPEPIKKWSVALPHKEIEKLLGISLEHAQVQKILTDLEITISQKSDVYLCHIPTRRRDLSTPEDLIEEIGRIYGYEKIRPRPLQEAVHAPSVNQQRFFERKTKDLLISSGFSEVRSYSFYSTSDAQAAGVRDAHVTLKNPMSEEQECMRRTLAIGLLHASRQNQTYTDRSYLFEIGRLYAPSADSLPEEKLMLGLTITDKSSDGGQFYTLKGLIDTYLNTLGIHDHYYSEQIPTDLNLPQLHPSRASMIHLASGEVIGTLGEIGKKLNKHFGIKNAFVAFGELDLDLVRTVSQETRAFKPLAKYPSVQRDLSMIVPSRTRVADMEKIIASAGTALLQTIDLFDLYINPKNQERSMAFHLIFSARERTLKSQEVEEIITNIITALESEGAMIKR